jgi:hypothetical protein
MKKADFSRMVSIDLAPSEAADLAAVCEAMLKIDLAKRCLTLQQRLTLEGAIGHLTLQLKILQWPANPAAKAPIPV